MTQKIIDPHIHFFDLTKGNYDWLRPENPPHWPDKSKICKGFTYDDLRLSEDLSLAGLVHIEAGFNNAQPISELEFVCGELDSVSNKDLAFGMIAFLDMIQSKEDFQTNLDAMMRYQNLRGIRHILDDNIEAILAHPNFEANANYLAQNNLCFELQFDLKQKDSVEMALDVFFKLSSLRVIINHVAFASEKDGAYLEQLATLDNFYIKVSGLEMSDRKFSQADLTKLFKLSIASFGSNRVMAASNFPLITLSMTYAEYWNCVKQSIQQLNESTNQLMFENAKRIYQL